MGNKQKFSLDTTVFYENLKAEGNEVVEYLNENTGKRRFSVYLTLIEFRLGLIYNWVDLYLKITASRDVSKSLIDVSNSMKSRELTNKIILEAMMIRLGSSVEGETDQYLKELEACILYAEKSINQLHNKFFGSFSDHPIVRFKIKTKDDFEEFYRLCNEEKVVDFVSYLSDRRSSLIKLKEHIKSVGYKGDDGERAKKVVGLLDTAINETHKCNHKNKNQQFGDLVITLDTNRQYILVSKDKSFPIYAEGQNKRVHLTNF